MTRMTIRHELRVLFSFFSVNHFYVIFFEHSALCPFLSCVLHWEGTTKYHITSASHPSNVWAVQIVFLKYSDVFPAPLLALVWECLQYQLPWWVYSLLGTGDPCRSGCRCRGSPEPPGSRPCSSRIRSLWTNESGCNSEGHSHAGPRRHLLRRRGGGEWHCSVRVRFTNKPRGICCCIRPVFVRP